VWISGSEFEWLAGLLQLKMAFDRIPIYGEVTENEKGTMKNAKSFLIRVRPPKGGNPLTAKAKS